MAIKRLSLRSMFLVCLVATVTVPLLSGCDKDPRNYTQAEVQQFFNAHRAQLEKLIALIRDCQDVKQISSNQELNGLPDNNCSNHGEGYRDHIARQLAKLNILDVVVDWIVQRPNGTYDYHQFDGVSFVLSSYGIVAGPGGGSAIWYFVKPLTDTSGLVPLTPPPYHWFFKKFD